MRFVVSGTAFFVESLGEPVLSDFAVVSSAGFRGTTTELGTALTKSSIVT